MDLGLQGARALVGGASGGRTERPGHLGHELASDRTRLSEPAVQRLQECAADEVIVTNTLPIPPEKEIDCLTVLSIAPLISAAVKEVFQDGSVTSLFGGGA